MDEWRDMLRTVVKQVNQAQPGEGSLREGSPGEHALGAYMPFRMEMGPFGDTVKAVFTNGRQQDISIEEDGDYYVLTSVVMGAQRVQNMGDDVFLPWLWERNAHTDIVAFALDKKGRLVGRTTHLKQTMDLEEARFYIELLARECDQMEYLLTGVDVQ